MDIRTEMMCLSMKMRVFMDRNVNYIPNRDCDKTKKETSNLLISWCGGRDSNSHRITPTTPSK